ncbi:hypothetical protein RJ641_034862 [Dillenia turbinata]|uniref:Uncharacterized protein n=1 Tax=Dillenia turbinata TaxID=194707 RepID=A0AAN8VWC1_9MAGN
MAMRDLVAGGAAFAVPGSSSSSNPVAALANALIGSSSKTTQERLKELPASIPTTSDRRYYPEAPTLPGSDFDQEHYLQPSAQGSDILHGFRAADQGHFADVWDDIHHVLPPHLQGRASQPHHPQFVHVFGQVNSQLQPTLDDLTWLLYHHFVVVPCFLSFGIGVHYESSNPSPSVTGPPQRVLSNFLHSFPDSSRSGIPFCPAPLSRLGLSEVDKQCIRDRTSIMASHTLAHKSDEFINAQVDAFLSSLDIDNSVQTKGHILGRFRMLEDYLNEYQGIRQAGHLPADGWVTEFDQHRAQEGDPESCALSFERQHGINGWASEFEREQSQMALSDQMRGADISNFATMEQTQMLAHTLAQNYDPKFQDQADEFGHQVGEDAFGDETTDNRASAYDGYLVAAKQQSGGSIASNILASDASNTKMIQIQNLASDALRILGCDKVSISAQADGMDHSSTSGQTDEDEDEDENDNISNT